MVQMMKRSRKQRTEAAIGYALERRWDLAADENRSLLADFPDDIEAANRLGKALTELGELDDAAEAYRRSLKIDASNVIARRNLTRIEEMQAEAGKTKRPAATGKRPRAAAPAAPAAIRPHSLIEESGKSAEFTLVEPNMAALRRVSAGDPAELVPAPRGASVQSTSGAILGHLEPSAGLRLRRLMEGGNTYAVVIRKVGEEATIYVREILRAPGQQDQPSFLPAASAARRRAAAPRAYTKPSIVRYGGGSDSIDDDGEEPDGGNWGGGRASSSDDEMDEAGFGDATQGDDDDDDALGVDDDDEPMNDRDDDEDDD